MFLSPEELIELTGRRRSDAQVRTLCAMGVEHRVRPDGSVAVLQAHVEQLFGVAPVADREVQNAEPDWSAL